MTGDPTKHCLVAYATPERQLLWPVVLPRDATVGDALDAARRLSEGGEADESADAAPRGPRAASGSQCAPIVSAIPWDTAAVGIFGEPCDRAAVPRDGDRIEIYRPLRTDPKQARRDRVASSRRAPGRNPLR